MSIRKKNVHLLRVEGENYCYRVARVAPDGALADIGGEWEKVMPDEESIAYSDAAPSASEEASGEEPLEEDGPEAADAPEAAVAASGEESEDGETESSGQGSGFHPNGIAVGDDGDLYICQRDSIARFAPDGRFKAIVGGSDYPKFTYYNGGLAILSFGQVSGGANTFALYDTDGGGIAQELNLQALQSAGFGMRVATGPDGALYVANTSGIYRLVPEGTTWERMVDGDLCSLSIPSMSISQFVPHGDNEFLTLTEEQHKPALINYAYSASTPTRPNTELTIATLAKNYTLLQAAGEFRRLHPEVLVTVQTLLEEDGSATAADAIRALNTQLLARKGPDLLLLDGLPLDSYIEKGVLADMSDWLGPIVEGELVPNVAGALGENGELYAVPARFNLPTIWGRPEAVSAAANLDSLVSYAESSPGGRLLYDMNRRSLFRYFSSTSASAWLDGNRRLDEAVFAEYLELIKRLADTIPGAAAEEFEMAMTPGFTVDGIDTGGALDLPFGYAELFSAELNGFQSLMVPNGSIATLYGLVISAETTSIEDSLIPGHVALLPGQASGVFLPSCVMGINAAGKQQELAREFIKAILGETVQYSDLQDGFPVNRVAVEKNIIRVDDLYWSVGLSDKETGEFFIMEMGWPSHGAFRAVCALFDQLDTPYMPDEPLMEMIRSETEGFFIGTMSSREAAAAVAARLELYRAEQG